jgi:hypothetical protein
LTFTVYPLRFEFQAIDEIRFPRHAGNLFRGALGSFLRAENPVLQELLFHQRREDAPSGLRTPPRPFVLRVAHLDAARIVAGETFHAGLHLFETRNTAGIYADLVGALSRLETAGIGAGRARARLICSEGLATPVFIPFVADGMCEQSIAIDFLTPTEIRGCGATEPIAFGALFRRMRDRICALQLLYGHEKPDLDVRELAARADRIRTLGCSLTHMPMDRRSSRTGDVHAIGGFTGYACFVGDIGWAAPWLEASVYAGVGAKTVWGNGQISVRGLGEAA